MLLLSLRHLCCTEQVVDGRKGYYIFIIEFMHKKKKKKSNHFVASVKVVVSLQAVDSFLSFSKLGSTTKGKRSLMVVCLYTKLQTSMNIFQKSVNHLFTL